MKKIRGYELIHGITGQIFATNEGTATVVREHPTGCLHPVTGEEEWAGFLRGTRQRVAWYEAAE